MTVANGSTSQII